MTAASGQAGQGRARVPARARLRGAAGFTLLEVMIALMILAMGLAAVGYANSVSISQVARVTRMTTASFLMEGVVNDIHAHYLRQGFPTNSIEDRECELPVDFQRDFRCRYDLKALELTPDVLSGIVQAGIEGFMGGTGAAAGGGAGTSGGGGATPSPSPSSGPAANPNPPAAGQIDPTQLAALAPLLGGDPAAFAMYTDLCNINLGKLVQAVGMLPMVVPQVVDLVAKKTRQLTVRLSWKEGPRKDRELVVQTFIVSIPEEEKQAANEAEKAREIDDMVRNSAPIPCTPPCPSGKRCVNGRCV